MARKTIQTMIGLAPRRPPLRPVRPATPRPLVKPPQVARVAAQSAAVFTALVALAAYATYALNRAFRERVPARRKLKLAAFDEALVAFESFSSWSM